MAQPGAEADLAGPSRLRVRGGEQRRREVEADPLPALELLPQLRLEDAVRIEPGHFVFVLVGHEMREGFHHRTAERLAPGDHPPFHLPRPLHPAAVALGPGPVLPGREMVGPEGDARIEPCVLAPLRLRAARGRLRIAGELASPEKGASVELHRNAVELDRTQQGFGGDREQAPFGGEAEKQEVGGDRVAQKLARKFRGLQGQHRLIPRRGAQRIEEFPGREPQIGIAGEGPRGNLGAVDDASRASAADGGRRSRTRSDHEIATEKEIGAAVGDARCAEPFGILADLDEGEDGTALLGETDHVERRHRLALEMGGHGEQGGQGHDARTADPRDDDAIGARAVGTGRFAEIFERWSAPLHPAPRHRPLDGHETRTEAAQAGIVRVAGALIDAALAAEGRLEREHGDAVRLRAAVAAALADAGVDHHPLRALRRLAPLATAPELGGAGLVVDDGRHAGCALKAPLHLEQFLAGMDPGVARPFGTDRIFSGLVRHHRDLDHPLGLEQAGDAGHGERADLHLLAAGHGDRVVVEDLEGDVGARSDRGAHGQGTGVEEGAVADVLEDVPPLHEGRLAEPGGALATHLGEGRGPRIHPLHHEVTADAGDRPRALGKPERRAVVGTARTEPGHPLRRRAVGGARLRGLLEPLDATRERAISGGLHDAPAEREGDAVGGKRAVAREEIGPVAIALAFDDGPVLASIEQGLDLILDERPLLLHHEHPRHTGNRALEADRIEREGEPRLVEAHPEPLEIGGGEFEEVERGEEIGVGLAAGDDAEMGIATGAPEAVDVVRPRKRFRRLELEQVQAALLGESHALADAVIGPAQLQPVRRRLEVVGESDPRMICSDLQGLRALHRVVDAFEGHPGARETGHGDAVEAEFEDFADARGIEHRHHGIDHGELALVCRGAALAQMIVAEEKKDAPERRGAEQIAVADGIARTVDAGSLAVPDGEYAIVLLFAEQPHLLGALAGGGGEVLVDGRLVADVVALQQRLRPGELLIVGAERRAPISGDVAGRVMARPLIPQPLLDGKTDERLDAGQQHPAFPLAVAFVEGDAVIDAQDSPPRTRPAR